MQPNDPDSYYASRELVPSDMLDDVNRAKIVITNFHAFKLRERIDLSKGGRQLLQGRLGEELDTLETEGQMLQRVMPDLMGLKNILAINDEAHHCYREKPPDADDEDLKGDDRKEAEKNNEAARLWISGLETVNRKLGLARVFDLSATPFFLRGSGYAEGTHFRWTVSDFSLMDAIECGIVKLPRVPVADNIPGNDMPMFRNLWEHIRSKMRAYVKNHSLGFEVPYRFGSEMRKYRPDFIVLVDDGHGSEDLLHLVVEIKGYRGEDAKEKKATMETYWVPGVNHLGAYGRWAFAEFTDVYEMESDFKAKVAAKFDEMIEAVGSKDSAVVAGRGS